MQLVVGANRDDNVIKFCKEKSLSAGPTGLWLTVTNKEPDGAAQVTYFLSMVVVVMVIIVVEG